MADPKGKGASETGEVPTASRQQPRTIGLGVRLVPSAESDQPRVAMSHETLANLRQQLGSALQGLTQPG